MTLIDPEGIVFANDLFPQLGFERNAARIDEALAASGLEAPGE